MGGHGAPRMRVHMSLIVLENLPSLEGGGVAAGHFQSKQHQLQALLLK